MTSRSDALDLRSDTVTRPDPAMRRAMAEAEVGDDVYREDPTVRRLEELSAASVGAEAALLTPSGTMANQIALHLHGSPGQEVVGEADSHVFHYEMGAMSVLSGLFPRPVPGTEGVLDPARLRDAIQPDIEYLSRTGVLVLENTHNLAGGVVLDPDTTRELVTVARSHGLAVHLDGARIFNAAVHLGVEAPTLARGADSVMFGLSKGLGAPVGSMLCGPRELVEEARRVRKMFGGGMRQAGIIAAAGVVALERGFDALARDHEHARLLAETLAELPGLSVDLERVQTNIVIVEVGDAWTREEDQSPAEGFLDFLRHVGVRAVSLGPRRVRFVTHRDAGPDQIEAAVERIRNAAGEWVRDRGPGGG